MGLYLLEESKGNALGVVFLLWYNVSMQVTQTKNEFMNW